MKRLQELEATPGPGPHPGPHPDPVKCVMCPKDHYLMHCPVFKGMSAEDRRTSVEKHQLCSNCLGKHATAACPSTRGCGSCGERHHTMLHDAFRDGSTLRKSAHHTQDCRYVSGKVLLAIAMIHVADRFRKRHAVRALIDQGSEITMMSEGLAQRLQLPRTHSSMAIFGVGGHQTSKAKGRVNLDISARKVEDSIKVTAVILPTLTTYVHSCSRPYLVWRHLQGLQLADPSPGRKTPVEVLLGADVYPAILNYGVRKGDSNEP